ncbi:cytotoxic translational repressor of toxin-antitoxin stability system [Burkholderia gladioli]|uniref:type II toxin-antitoxin system RelE family toxin n=1 Tax=Burkholderia TaxID=32008 RepID=UPI00051007B0|nr:MULTISPECIES: type II toxin-antitoxin system RelE/ParE family toxin [Burkholderia]AQQ29562.1 cytotoxic translational repressor of toxin-antitoxin stability system [Burkholderia cenocepacia]KGE07982.1 cytotoxic translational repressor of toxin-antitoxin stability system [Burkholderia gladioli]MBR8414751.1 type II toxin-antitoxin system RelE/ParE family toxin [Burkholderia cenocepacia]ONV90231.1 cytotoxic translational repressor of toxin-antitoxin stability system [Burkholderia cenocepacia]ON
MNSIKWTPKAFKQLRKLDRQIQTAIRDSVDTLEAMPNCQNVKSLTNHEYDYRLRVGNYRVLFNWDGEIKVVEIEEVKKRDERTY